MALLKSLMIRTARRLANDPAARAQAVELAKKAKPAVDRAVQEAKSIPKTDNPAYDIGRFAGRMKRKYFDAE